MIGKKEHADETFPLARIYSIYLTASECLFYFFYSFFFFFFFLLMQKKPEQEHVGREDSTYRVCAYNKCKETGFVCTLPDW